MKDVINKSCQPASKGDLDLRNVWINILTQAPILSILI